MQLELLNSGFLEKACGKNYEQKLGSIIYVASVTFVLADLESDEDVLDR